MTNPVPNASPNQVLAAGSLIDVPVTIAQAQAVSDRAVSYEVPTDKHVGLQSWRIPAPGAWLTSASIVGGQLEVHFRYVPNEAFDLSDPLVGLDVVVYDDDGTVLSDQDYGLFTDNAAR